MSDHPHEDHFSADDADDVRRFVELFEPDRRHVPLKLKINDGAQVYDADGNCLGVLVVAAGIFGHLDRLRRGFFNEGNDDEDEAEPESA